ncbi:MULTISPECIES: YqeG family HAD IIIA-type phosphatase [Lactobacillaceae]|uniref:YqeG family HAD IIIA-type phosphatase n=1 Tax=Lactobacillaceae TaxID=33958 RepID=UPI000C1B6A73|nr:MULTISPECIES: YqeG family HAD IIIA-type phosphatase [Lactobacillaceae]
MFKPFSMLNSITDLTIKDLKELNITTIMTDLDNTLIPWNSDEYTLTLRKWLLEMDRNGIKVLVVSNNSYERVEKAVSGLDIEIVARAKKPLPFEINKYIQSHNLSKDSILFVGDQVMTDVFVGNIAGLKTILVKPLVDTDEFKTRINRQMERPILKMHRILDKKLNWKDSLHDKH